MLIAVAVKFLALITNLGKLMVMVYKLRLWSEVCFNVCLMTSNSGSMLSRHCWRGLLSLIIFTKLKNWYFLFSYPLISCNQIYISVHLQNSYYFALTFQSSPFVILKIWFSFLNNFQLTNKILKYYL